jgi:hypothetical protein
MGTYGFGDFLKIVGTDIKLEVNTGGEVLGGLFRAMPVYSKMRKTDPVTGKVTVGLPVGAGDDPITLNFDGHELIGLDIGLADIAVADFLFLRGSLAFRKGDVFNVKVEMNGLKPLLEDLGAVAGLGMDFDNLNINVTAMTLGGANLSGFAGVGGPYRYGPDLNQDGMLDYVNSGAVGLAIDNVDFGLAMMKPSIFAGIPALEASSPQFVSAKANIATAALVGIDPSLISAKMQDIEVNINTFMMGMGYVDAVLQVLGPPYIDFKNSQSFKDFTEDSNHNGVLDLGEDLNANLRLDPGEDLNGDGILQLSEDRNQNSYMDKAGFALPAGGNNMVFLDFNSEIIQAKVGYACRCPRRWRSPNAAAKLSRSPMASRPRLQP